jgi:hypothetical protein
MSCRAPHCPPAQSCTKPTLKDLDVGLPDDPLLPAASHSHLRTIDTQLSSVDLSEWGQQDVAIAAFLMLLWKDMYPAREAPLSLKERVEEEWDTWGRPPGGFVDLGCVSPFRFSLLPCRVSYRSMGQS